MPPAESQQLTVFAPATVANVACGYDILGFAIDGPGDYVTARLSDQPGLRITAITGDEGKLPTDPAKNTASVSALSLLEHLGKTHLGIELEIHKRMPFGSGLGSSAASAVAGAFAINALLGNPLTKRQLLIHAMAGESSASKAWHADNVSPCLLGGITLVRDNPGLDVIDLPVPRNLHAAVVYPEVEILTCAARELLPESVTLCDSVNQTGNLGGLVASLFQSDFALLSRCLQDVLIEPHRKQLIPGFDAAKQAALHAGALGFSISGSGPSVFALCQGKDTARQVADAIAGIFSTLQLTTTTHLSAINSTGAAS